MKKTAEHRIEFLTKIAQQWDASKSTPELVERFKGFVGQNVPVQQTPNTVPSQKSAPKSVAPAPKSVVQKPVSISQTDKNLLQQAQKVLWERGYYPTPSKSEAIEADGILGQRTIAALKKYVQLWNVPKEFSQPGAGLYSLIINEKQKPPPVKSASLKLADRYRKLL